MRPRHPIAPIVARARVSLLSRRGIAVLGPLPCSRHAGAVASGIADLAGQTLARSHDPVRAVARAVRRHDPGRRGLGGAGFGLARGPREDLDVAAAFSVPLLAAAD